MAIDIHKMFCSNKVRCLDTGGFFCEYGKTRGDCVLDDIGDWD